LLPYSNKLYNKFSYNLFIPLKYSFKQMLGERKPLKYYFK
jgi:hypothetical protein